MQQKNTFRDEAAAEEAITESPSCGAEIEDTFHILTNFPCSDALISEAVWITAKTEPEDGTVDFGLATFSSSSSSSEKMTGAWIPERYRAGQENLVPGETDHECEHCLVSF